MCGPSTTLRRTETAQWFVRTGRSRCAWSGAGLRSGVGAGKERLAKSGTACFRASGTTLEAPTARGPTARGATALGATALGRIARRAAKRVLLLRHAGLRGRVSRHVQAVLTLVRRDVVDELIDLGLAVRGAAAGPIGEHQGAELAQHLVASPVRLRLVQLCLALLRGLLGLLRKLRGLRLYLVHKSHMSPPRAELGTIAA